MNNVKRGPGYWKMNVNILNDDNYVKEVKQCIAMCENEYSTENPQVKWEICKIKVKELTQAFGKKKLVKVEKKYKKLKRNYVI